MINSAFNPRFKIWRSLLESRGIKKHGYFILAGHKIVPEILAQLPEMVEDLLFAKENPLAKSHPGTEVSLELFRQLDIFGTNYPLIVGRSPNIEPIDLSEPAKGLEVLCALGDPANLGAMLRSAEAFGVTQVILLQECANPLHPKCLRSSSGSALRVKLRLGPSIKDVSGPIVALDKSGENIAQFKWPKDVRLLIGEEGLGIPEPLANLTKVTIPMVGQVESLNAVAAASIALSQYSFAAGALLV